MNDNHQHLTLPALANHLRTLRDEKSDMDRVVRGIAADIESTEQRLIKEMRGVGTTQFTHAGSELLCELTFTQQFTRACFARLHTASPPS